MNAITTTSASTPVARGSCPSQRPCVAAYGKAVACLRRAEPWGRSALLVALRVTYGWFFAQAGYGKLMHFERTAGYFESLSLPVPAVMAGLVAATELAGGILLALGLATRHVAAALSVILVTAYLTAHAQEAFTSLTAFTEQAPFPFLVATLTVLAFGPGRFSVDALVQGRARRRARSRGAEATD